MRKRPGSETPPANWDEMVEMGKALTKEDGSQWGVMVPSTGYAYWMFQAFALQNGVGSMNSEGPAPISTLRLSRLEYWVSLSQDHGVMPSARSSGAPCAELPTSGRDDVAYHW